METLRELAKTLLRLTTEQGPSNQFPTAIEGLSLMRSDQPTKPSYRVFKPALCIVAQGAKWAFFGEERIDYGEGEALLVSVAMPALGCVVEATPAKPYLGLILEFDLAIMREIAEMLPVPSKESGCSGRGLFLARLNEPLAECVLRLVRLLDRPEAIPVLYPSVMREICYWVLTGPHGGEAVNLAAGNNHPQPVIRAIHALRDHFAEPIRIEELASLANMSSSAFHRGFRAITSMSPLQYQKQLRLIEARRLLVSEVINAETAGYKVGYESPAQFSREYARMFGTSPKRESLCMRRQHNQRRYEGRGLAEMTHSS